MKDTKTRLESYQPLWSNWYLDSIISTGSSGDVYRLKQKNYEIYSAVKVITMLLEREPGVNLDMKLKSLSAKRVRAENEIRAMYQLESCPYTVHCRNHDIKDIFDDRGRVVGFDVLIQMKYYVCLQNKLFCDDTVLPEKEVIKLGIQVGEGLKATHALNIIHRDIKPANIFVNDNNDYLLGDFGISKQVHSGYFSTIAGTIEFMAPEVFRASSEKKYEKTADIYSLGLVMYTLLNNNYPPFTSEKSSQNDIELAERRRLFGEELLPLDNVSDSLNKILLKCCRSDPRERYQTIEEFLADLAAVNVHPPKSSSAPVTMPAVSSVSKPVAKSNMYRTVVADKTEQGNATAVKAPAVGDKYRTVYADSNVDTGIPSPSNNAAYVQQLAKEKVSAVSAAPAVADRYKTIYAESNVNEDVPHIDNNSAYMQQPSKRRKSSVGIITGVSSVALVAAIAVTSAVAINGKDDNKVVQPGESISESIESAAITSESKIVTSTPYSTSEVITSDTPDIPVESDVISIVNSSTPEPESSETTKSTTKATTPTFAEPEMTVNITEAVEATPAEIEQMLYNYINNEGELDTGMLYYVTRLQILGNEFVSVDTSSRKSSKSFDVYCWGTDNFSLVGSDNVWHDFGTLTDISFVKYMPNIVDLEICANQVNDISAVSSLSNLQFLRLSCNQITNIEPVSNLTQLNTLTLCQNKISDITPIQNLPNLWRYLDLRSNEFHDITVLRNLSVIRDIELTGNDIDDISVLGEMTSLTSLAIGYCNIDDVSVLANLTNLRYLGIWCNNISDITPLYNLTNLETISLSGNPLTTSDVEEFKEAVPYCSVTF